ncbi:MAG: DMT family transporter [Clostridiales bacterium]|nr:DMT family transporter [Clostridiales bacterium]
MRKKRISLALMCLLVCIWAMDYIVVKEALTVLDPMSLLFLKYILGALFVFIIKLKKDRDFRIQKKDIIVFVLCALTGEILYFACEYTAMYYIPVSLITIILAFVPIAAIVTERILFKRKVTYKIVLGIIICIIGVAVVLGGDLSSLMQGRIIGYVLAFIAVLCWNAYNFITIHVSGKYSNFTVAFYQMFCTLLIILPYVIHKMPPIQAFTPGLIGGIIYLGVVNAGAGFLIMIRALKDLGATVTSIFSNFLPVATTILGWLILGEAISFVQIIGGIIVIVSSCIVITEKGKMEENSNGREAEPDNAD